MTTAGQQFLIGLNRDISYRLQAQGLKKGTAAWDAGYARETDNFLRAVQSMNFQKGLDASKARKTVGYTRS